MPTSPRLGHAALGARDARRLSAFYRDLLDLKLVRQGDHPRAGHKSQREGDFVCRQDLVFCTDLPARHVGFEVDTRAGLASYHARACELGVEIPYAHATGRAVSFFVRDPEGNLIEVYWTTGLSRRGDRPLGDRRAIHGSITGR